MRLTAFKREYYGSPGADDRRGETLREYVHRHLHTTGSAFDFVQRNINYGLTNAEWNALPPERRVALVREST